MMGIQIQLIYLFVGFVSLGRHPQRHVPGVTGTKPQQLNSYCRNLIECLFINMVILRAPGMILQQTVLYQ